MRKSNIRQIRSTRAAVLGRGCVVGIVLECSHERARAQGSGQYGGIKGDGSHCGESPP